jgi:hypothetical protein
MLMVCNVLDNEIKFEMPSLGYCFKCYLPAPRGETTNAFHPESAQKCIVFPFVAAKALTCGSRLWLQKVRNAGAVQNEGDPLWLKDLLERGMCDGAEDSVQTFARILKKRTEEGDHWFLRVFYHMIKEAVERDERM